MQMRVAHQFNAGMRFCLWLFIHHVGNLFTVVDDAAVAIIYCRSSMNISARVMTFIFILLCQLHCPCPKTKD